MGSACVSLAILLGLTACSTRTFALPPAELDTLLRVDTPVATLLAIDRIEDAGNPAAGPWLLAIQCDAARPLDLRARAAAALVGLGYPDGQNFCVAVPAGQLRSSKARDQAQRLPISERWAFARELAVRALRTRLLQAKRVPPPYDVNYGAPDLRTAAAAFERELRRAPPLTPAATRGELAARVPRTPPAGFTADAWQDARTRCLNSARP